MNYPVWEVPYIGAIWVVGIIAIIHVYVSHFAVGGGAFLAVTETIAARRGDTATLAYLKRHSNFFLILTSVIGAITGVGIWFSIGLASPSGTSALIHNFVFLWATEWVMFLVEITTAFVYYYTWDRIDSRGHQVIGWIYAVTSWLTLIIINGILTFMLTPGQWLKTGSIWHAFFNPTYWPSIFLRSTAMAVLAGLFAMVTSMGLKDTGHRDRLMSYAGRWVMAGFFAFPFFLAWYLSRLPAPARELLINGLSNVAPGNLAIVTRMILGAGVLSLLLFAAAYIGPVLSPRLVSWPAVALFLFLGLGATGMTELVRESLRKPYVIYGYMYGNSVLVSDLKRPGPKSALSMARWVTVDRITPSNMEAAGKQIFRTHCMSCHTVSGYRGIAKLTKGWTEEFAAERLKTLDATKVMPPFVGTEQERRALARYLIRISRAANPMVAHASIAEPPPNRTALVPPPGTSAFVLTPAASHHQDRSTRRPAALDQ